LRKECNTGFRDVELHDLEAKKTWRDVVLGTIRHHRAELRMNTANFEPQQSPFGQPSQHTVSPERTNHRPSQKGGLRNSKTRYRKLETSGQVSLEDLEMSRMSDSEGTDDEEAGLAKYGYRRSRDSGRGARSHPRQENELVAPKDAAKLADKDVIKRLLINVVLIGLWYLFSLSISIVRSVRTWRESNH
jgi:hypothetical protein